MTDWDFYWNLINRISQIGLIFVRAYFLCRLVSPFLRKREEGQCRSFRERTGRFFYAALPGIGYAVVMLLFALYPREIHVIPVYAASAAAAFAVMYVVDRRNREQKIFLAVIFYLLQWITWGITLVPWRGVYDVLLLAVGRPKNYLIQCILYAEIGRAHV